MKAKVLLVLLTSFFLVFGCVLFNDKLTGNWERKDLGVKTTMFFDGQGNGATINVLGSEAFTYKIISDTKIELTTIRTNKTRTASYELAGEEILVFDGFSFTKNKE